MYFHTQPDDFLFSDQSKKRDVNFLNDHGESDYQLGLNAYHDYSSHTFEDKNIFLAFKRAAKYKHTKGCVYLGICYINQIGWSGKDIETGLRYIREAYPDIQDLSKKDDPEAQFLLALIYEKGWNGLKSNNKAFYWYQKSAEKEYPPAQNKLANMYFNGKGVKRSYKNALYWYKKASKNGNANANRNLAYMYAEGLGVKLDNEKALRLYRHASSKDIVSQINLSWIYKNNHGISETEKECSKRWSKSPSYMSMLISTYQRGALLNSLKNKHLLKRVEKDNKVSNR